MLENILNKLMGSEEEPHCHPEPPPPSPEERQAEIAKMAYHLWQTRGGGMSTLEEKQKDWRAAELMVDAGYAVEDQEPQAAD